MKQRNKDADVTTKKCSAVKLQISICGANS